MAAPENMNKPDLVKEVRRLRQEAKLLKRQIEEKTNDEGSVIGDVKAPVFYFDNKTNKYITAIASVNLNQLSEIMTHPQGRHMAEHRIVKYCEEVLYFQEFKGDKNE